MSSIPILTRFNKPSKELLVDFINKANNTNLDHSKLDFQTPVLLNAVGLSTVGVRFSESTNWSTEVQTLTYYRVELGKLSYAESLVVHSTGEEVQDLLDSILEQYGILLEPTLIDVIEVELDLSDVIQVNDLNGFLPEGEESESNTIPTAFQNNRQYRIVFKPEHLTFFGEINVYVRPSIELLGKNIDSLIDLREFYKEGSSNTPPVELLLLNGEARLSDDVLTKTTRRVYEITLYNTPVDTLVDGDSKVVSLLSDITKDDWIIDAEQAQPFNLFGAKVIYNGLTSQEYPPLDPAYNYLMVLELSSSCSNLSGLLRIAYRYAESSTLANQIQNKASVQPIFTF